MSGANPGPHFYLKRKETDIMDLGAYANIESLGHIMVENNIDVPRLRGVRLMSEEPTISAEDIDEQIRQIWLYECENACESDFVYHPVCFEYSRRTNKLKRKYIKYDENGEPIDVRWENAHGEKRKLFKYLRKAAEKRVCKNYETFNKYCGQTNILYIHARIGGGNWSYFGAEVKDQPWFIEKVDDPFDSTYCDIYAKIKKEIDI